MIARILKPNTLHVALIVGLMLSAVPASAAQHRCPRPVAAPGSSFVGVGAERVAVRGVSCARGYKLIGAWFRAAPHNTTVDGFHSTARDFVVTMRRRTQVVRFRLYGTD